MEYWNICISENSSMYYIYIIYVYAIMINIKYEKTL